MSKIEPLSDINASYAGITKLNSHIDKIVEAFNNTLSRDGSSPNQMEADIDMNDNQLINLGAPTLSHNAATKAYVDEAVTGTGGEFLQPYSENLAELAAYATAGFPENINITATNETIAWPLSERFAQMVNVLGHIPQNLHAGIRAGTNTTDLTTYCANALAAAQTANKALYYPSGVYLRNVNNVGADDVVVEGDGYQLSIIRQANNTNNYAFLVNGYKRVTFRNLGFDGNKANQTTIGTGIRAEGAADDLVIEGCKFFDWYSIGIGLAGTGARPQIRNNIFTTNGTYGLISVGFVEGTASGNYAYSNGLHGLAATGSSHKWLFNANHSYYNTGCGILIINSNNSTCSSNFCWNNTQHGIQHNTVQFGRTVANNCQYNGISGVDFFASPDGVADSDYCDYNTVRGWEIDSTSTRGKISNPISAGNNGDTDVSVFRSASVELIGVNCRIRVWDAGVLLNSGHTIAAGGAGYTNGTFTVTVVGGTFLTAAQLSVTVSGGAVTSINSVVNAGSYWTLPANPVSVTGLSGGAGATITLNWSGINSNTCANLQVIGGGLGTGNSLTIVSGSSSNVRVIGWQGTIVDSGNHIVSSPACANRPDVGEVRVLFRLIGANMNSTADQQFTKVGTFTTWTTSGAGAYKLVNPSVSLTTAAGGVYSAASKGGDQLVASSQTYASATTVGTSSQSMTGSALGNGVRTETPYLSLTTPQGAAATADLYIFGTALS